jgi:hypothetical protein
MRPSANQELVNVIIPLFILSFTMCLLMSFLGGIIAALISFIWPESRDSFTAESLFKLSLLLNKVPILLTEILSRFPVNIPDRILSVFGGYGLALLLKKFLIR